MSTPEDSAPSPTRTASGPAPVLVTGGDLPPGYVVGEYRVERVLGRGGMGVVYSGTQPLIEKQVAIKVLNLELSSDPNLVRRFLDEARAVNRIRHPNIIDIFSFGQLADGRQYFVMEYLEGRTLADCLLGGGLVVADLPPLLGQICDALDAAHGERIVHRDLKPENVWIVEPKRGRPFVKLLDFGIAKLLATGEQSTTQAGVLMGTPQYMSPEQCHGRAVDHRTDLYAMGVILYQIFTGHLPFAGETFAEVLTKQLVEIPAPPSTHAALPAALDELILRCLAKDPAERPQSARELGETLAAILLLPQPALPSRAGAASTTTLQASAQAGGFDAEPVASRRRWPAVALLLAVAAASAFVATRFASSPHQQPAMSTGPATLAPAPIAPRVPAPDAAVAASARPPAPVAEAPTAVEPPSVKRHDPTGKAGERETPRAPRRGSATSRAASSGLVTDNPFR